MNETPTPLRMLVEDWLKRPWRRNVYIHGSADTLLQNAADALARLEAENAELRAELDRLRRINSEIVRDKNALNLHGARVEAVLREMPSSKGFDHTAPEFWFRRFEDWHHNLRRALAGAAPAQPEPEPRRRDECLQVGDASTPEELLSNHLRAPSVPEPAAERERAETNARERLDKIEAMFREPHNQSSPIGTPGLRYQKEIIMVPSEWYERLRALATEPPREP